MAIINDYTALLIGKYWYPGAPAGRGIVLTYSFSQTPSDYHLTANPAAAASFQPLTEETKALAREALRHWAAISGVTFLKTTQHVGDITFGFYDLATLGIPDAGGAS